MLGGPFPPLPDPVLLHRRMRRLVAQASLAVHKQHLVSGVLIRQFAAPIGQQGAPQAYSLNLEHPHAKLKGRGLETCGKAPIDDFVKFASQSLEQVWWRVENYLDSTFAAVRNGSALQPEHLDRLRDLVAIHHARSIQYYAVFEDSLLHASQQANHFWRQYPAVIDAIAASRIGLPGGDADDRERALQELHRPINEWIEAGALFRVMMESRYLRTRRWLRGFGVEILAPLRGEFVIGDIPALTVRKGMPSAGVNGGIGYAFADAIVLPIAPGYLIRVADRASRYVAIAEEDVLELNAWQVRGAFSYVYLRPGSGLEDYVRSVDRHRPSEGVYREFYQLCETLAHR